MVLVTSRDKGVVQHLPCMQQHPPRSSAWVGDEVEMECLSEAQSVELLARHATGTSDRTASDWLAEMCEAAMGTSSLTEQQSVTAQQSVKAFVARFGGLPLALELAGKALAGKERGEWRRLLARPEAWMKRAYKKLFDRLMHSWTALSHGEREALLDVVYFLKDHKWGLVECYCEDGVLAELQRVALVQLRVALVQLREGCTGVQQAAVGVHPAVVAFCKWYIKEIPAAQEHGCQPRLEWDPPDERPVKLEPDDMQQITVSVLQLTPNQRYFHDVSNCVLHAGPESGRLVAAWLQGRCCFLLRAGAWACSWPQGAADVGVSEPSRPPALLLDKHAVAGGRRHDIQQAGPKDAASSRSGAHHRHAAATCV